MELWIGLLIGRQSEVELLMPQVLVGASGYYDAHYSHGSLLVASSVTTL
jgi:hypothetical protein